MELIISDSGDKLSYQAANEIIQMINTNPYFTLGLATGNTPIYLYKYLTILYKQNKVSFRHVSTYNIDEYIGITKHHPSSFYSFMKEHLFDHIDIQLENINIPEGNVEDLENERERYEKLLNQTSPLDLQILGIGKNGHIGFNEPADLLTPNPHIVALSEHTKKANAAAFGTTEAVPSYALTMGVRNILSAHMVYFFAFGEEKAEILKQALEGPISTYCPGSLLQLHPNCKVFVDTEAAKYLSPLGYYKIKNE